MFAPRRDGTRGEDDSLLAFESETAPRAARLPPQPLVAPRRAQPAPEPQDPDVRRESTQGKLLLVASAIVAGVALAVAGVKYARASASAATPSPQADASASPPKTTGTLSVGTHPDGALVMIDGISYGVTPLKLSLPVGRHTLVLQQAGIRHPVPITIDASTELSQFVELESPPPLETTLPSTPVAGPNQPSLAPVTKPAPIVPPEAIAGWVSITSGIELQILENGRVVGTTSADRMMLPVGTHLLTFVNRAYGFQSTVTVQIAAGRTAIANIPLPNGSVSINALPWADVYVDGKSAGTTPLGNITVPLGSHEIVWKHPTLGERSRTIAVTALAPVRVSVDFSK